MDVSEILSKVTMACKKEDQIRCRDLVMKIKALVQESGHNKTWTMGNGTGRVLSAAFEAFSKICCDENVAVLEEILSALTLVFPLDGEAVYYLGSASSLHCMVWFLKSGDLSRRRNTVLVLEEIVASEQGKVNILSEIEGSMEALFELVKEPSCPTSSKASLIVIYHMVTAFPTNEKIVAKFVDLGLVSLLLEMLVDAEKSLCEKALGVLDGIFGCNIGREQGYNHALTMSIIVKKMFRVSDLATEFSVSILWKLCKNEEREEKTALAEALQVGAFKKLMLLLQIDCGGKTREKANKLLKLLNHHRDSLECIDSMNDFKDLKTPFLSGFREKLSNMWRFVKLLSVGRA